jgi:D-ribulokinase
MALLAASAVTGRTAAEVAGAMVHVREVLRPRPDRTGRFAAPYLRLVDELAGRGWLAPEVAAHARARAAR